MLRPDRQKGNADVDMIASEATLLAEADPNKQEDLIRENVLDPMEGEQTWPTDEELAEATANAGTTCFNSSRYGCLLRHQ